MLPGKQVFYDGVHLAITLHRHKRECLLNLPAIRDQIMSDGYSDAAAHGEDAPLLQCRHWGH